MSYKLPSDQNRRLGEATFTSSDFAYIAAFAHRNFGLNLPEAKQSLVQSRITRRMRKLGVTKFADYRRLIETTDCNDERIQILSALTTNVTSFFREEHHFKYLKENILPPLIKAANAGNSLRIWSAGCSTGQEAYSIAMVLLDLIPAPQKLDLYILATDIDPAVIKIADEGAYAASDFQRLDPVLVEKYFDDCGRGYKKPKPSKKLRDMIRFEVLNLAAPLRNMCQMDVIFCRNVAIYFDPNTQDSLWKSLISTLKPGGHLFIGHSERLSDSVDKHLRAVGVTTYQKIKTHGGSHCDFGGHSLEP